MRKLLSLTIALAILMVSSIPMMPQALACTIGEAPAMHDMEGMHDQAAHTVAAEQAKVSPGQDCIECGCGCHDSIDSLPHVLAPHSPGSSAEACTQSVERASDAQPMRPAMRGLRVFSPPPQHS